jgi:hypothetical protein
MSPADINGVISFYSDPAVTPASDFFIIMLGSLEVAKNIACIGERSQNPNSNNRLIMNIIIY